MTFRKGNRHGKAWKGRRHSLSGLKKKCNQVFSEYVRRKYANAGGYASCYTCGTTTEWSSLQCGHGIGGRRNAVLYDEEICRPQCVGCNVFKKGQYEVFTLKMIKEHGTDWWEKKLDAARLPVKYTSSDIESLIETYKAKLESL